LINTRVRATCVALLMAAVGPSALAAPVAGPDIYPFVAQIAEATAGAKIQGNQHVEKVVTFGRNASGELVVTSLSALAPGQRPQIPSGTVGVIVVHFAGQCGPPLAGDDYAASQGVLDFVASSTGDHLWEVATADGGAQVRSVEGPDRFGPWETFQADPSRYHSYPCAAAG
jgi:hypothetical protein